MPYTDLYKGRHSQPGLCYHITTVTKNRAPIFTDLYAGRMLVRELINLDQEETTQTLCYVVMPDHLHWLMQLKCGSIGSIMQRLKGRTSRAIGGGLWQERYYDHAVRKEEDLRVMARYIVANPLRKGIVDKIGDYPLWDAVWINSNTFYID